MKVVITDCDHETMRPEELIAAEHGADLVVAQAHTEDEIVDAASNADAIVVYSAKITDGVLARLPRLKAISRAGVGVDVVDVEAATRRGIPVTNVPDYGTEEVSDHAIALALTVARATSQLDRMSRAGRRSLDSIKPLHRLNTRTFALIGLGAIGAATGRKAKGLGYRVIGFDPARPAGSITQEGVEVVNFDAAIAEGDIISLHCPLNAKTHHLINRSVLERMKPTSSLVNTCRGGVVDTEALIQALTSGSIQSAGLDVFEEEPLPDGHPLLSLDNVTVTPHVGWYSEESFVEVKRRSVENAILAAQGALTQNIVNFTSLRRSYLENQAH